MVKADKIRERKAALLAKLKELEKEESAAVSAAKEARRKEDNRTKTLLGIVVAMSLKESASATMIAAISRCADKMTPTDRKFLATSKLWTELGLTPPLQDPAKPQEAAKIAPQATQAPKPAHIPAEPPKTAPAAFGTAANIAQDVTGLPRMNFYDKEEVKALGARYDADVKKWFVPAGADLTPFAKWL